MASLREFRKIAPPAPLYIPQDETVVLTLLTEPEGFVYTVEHVSPKNWRKSAECTYELGSCYGCEQQEYAWNQKIKVYIPVSYEGDVRYWSQGLGVNSGLWPIIDQMPTTKKAFEVTRSGAGKRTKYTAIPVDLQDQPVYNGRVDKVSLTAQIAYDKQEQYYKN